MLRQRTQTNPVLPCPSPDGHRYLQFMPATNARHRPTCPVELRQRRICGRYSAEPASWLHPGVQFLLVANGHVATTAGPLEIGVTFQNTVQQPSDCA